MCDHDLGGFSCGRLGCTSRSDLKFFGWCSLWTMVQTLILLGSIHTFSVVDGTLLTKLFKSSLLLVRSVDDFLLLTHLFLKKIRYGSKTFIGQLRNGVRVSVHLLGIELQCTTEVAGPLAGSRKQLRRSSTSPTFPISWNQRPSQE
ncbi:hypothetical protein RB195_000543 [Necator americanus]|uniref:Uncharacterized protein n=1 Tax=Necator americanus TaxID=51031 RepID=A0ABR1DA97_NECAM